MAKLSFDTVVRMFKELELDKQDWINKEQKDYYFNTNKFNNTKQPVEYYPKDLDNIKLNCPSGHVFTPAWLEKRFPIMPLRLSNGDLLRQFKAKTPCTDCGEGTDIVLPLNDYNEDAFIYGDEACRVLDDAVIISYSFVSQPRIVEQDRDFVSKFYSLKQNIAPSINPSHWCLHMMDLMNDRNRSKVKHLKHLSNQDAKQFTSELGELTSAYPNQLVKWNCTGIYRKPPTYKRKEEQAFKSRVYYSALMRVIKEHTDSCISPHVSFERTGSDGWAKNLFNGGRLTLMWPFLTSSVPVPSPEFKPPTASPYFEIADYVSYTIARYLFLLGKKNSGENVTMNSDPTWLGSVRYLGYRADGSCILETDNKYPLEKFLNGTIWHP